MRPGGAIREKWRILDGKEDEWYDLSSKVVAPPMSIKARVG
jgi:hypothetical protein